VSSEITRRLASAHRAYLRAVAEPIDVLRGRADGITLHPRLGTLGERARRLPHVVESLCRHGVLADHGGAAARAAALCHLDLAMEPVEEDASLHGLFGGEVFRARGEDSAVVGALESHVRPVAPGAELAPDAPGALLCIADRLDVLVQAFAHGLVPTPSGDPLGLRESAYGMLRTMLLHDARADLNALVDVAARPLASDSAWLSREDVAIRVGGFLRHRLKILLSRRFPEDRVHDVLRTETLCPSSLSEKLEHS
jgi:glycyl-tRNA synthetase beta subunit